MYINIIICNFPTCEFGAQLTYVATIQVDRLRLEGDERVTTDLRLLARGPSKVASSFSKFVINGFRFHTKDFDRTRLKIVESWLL